MQDNYLYIIIALAAITLAIIILLVVRNRSSKKNKLNNIPSKTVKNIDPLKSGLSKTRSSFLGHIAELLQISNKVDENLMNELEEALIKADVGVETSLEIIDRLREKIKAEKITDTSLVQVTLIGIIQHLMLEDYSLEDSHLQNTDKKPLVILFTGVNGVGKTTTIGKLAKRYVDAGKKVMLIAGDTFRAAAIDQLAIWAERAGADIARQSQGADPSAVVFDGLKKAGNNNFDVVLIDTAGRQHTKVNLMNELNKIDRTIKKLYPEAPHESLLVVDATTGQNALTQAEMFNKATPLSGIVLTKLDGTAKGGIVIGIKHQIKIPVKLIGVGESTADLRDFEVTEFLKAIFE
ncbi:MAG: signal recognition particle-docking protein FtsY [Candidatus Cloacimonetes bacterium]|nr:signal recognition particle-docking protein FtsY [Candidatus Cloacimonadota bacterium]